VPKLVNDLQRKRSSETELHTTATVSYNACNNDRSSATIPAGKPILQAATTTMIEDAGWVTKLPANTHYRGASTTAVLSQKMTQTAKDISLHTLQCNAIHACRDI